MRHFGLAVCLLAGLAATGCNSTSLMGSVSHETTSSTAGAPTPPAAVGQPSGSAAPQEGREEAATEVAYAAAYPKPDPMPAPQLYAASFKDAHPIDFGDRSPHGHVVHGVDVSRWQGVIDWKTLRLQGANFVFIKATDGGDHLDPLFHDNWKGAADAGIRRGAYHFYFWCRPAHEQAEWFIRNVPKQAGALPPVLDVEWNAHSRSCRKRPAQEKVVSEMKTFLDIVERHYGQRPIIYTAPDFYEDNLKGRFTDYPFWLRSVAAHPQEVYPGRDWVFWQYSGTGLSKGLGEQIDLNVFHGSERDWHAWLARATR